MLLRHQGYWTTPSFKVELSREDERRISDPDWVRQRLELAIARGYENDPALMVARILVTQGGQDVVKLRGQLLQEADVLRGAAFVRGAQIGRPEVLTLRI